MDVAPSTLHPCAPIMRTVIRMAHTCGKRVHKSGHLERVVVDCCSLSLRNIHCWDVAPAKK